jgi:hypothetical protein
MLAAARPETETTPASDALGCAWAALLSWTFLQKPFPGRAAPDAPLPGESAPPPVGQVARWRALLAGALLLAGPAIPLVVGGRDLDGDSLTIALALTPVVVAIAAAALGSQGEGGAAASSAGVPGKVWPGLAAAAGLLLVLVQPEVADFRSDVALLLAPLMTGIGAALFCAGGADRPEPAREAYAQPGGDLPPAGAWERPQSGRWSLRPATAALFGGAVLLGLGSGAVWWITGSRPVAALSAVACDGLTALLTVVALARLGSTRWSAQFSLLPLLVLLEGLALVRPAITGRAVAGLGLLAVASASLLLPPEDDAGDGSSTVPRVTPG